MRSGSASTAESAFQIPVRLPDGRPAVYSPFLVLESDGAVATGGELYGQPKKAGQVSLKPAGDLLVGRIGPKRHRRRHGDDVLEADSGGVRRASSGWCPDPAST